MVRRWCAFCGIWDGTPIHRAQVVKTFLSDGAAQRLRLEQLPGYAPGLNPVEGIWHYLKRVRPGNVCCRTLKEVRYEVRLAIAILRHKATVLANLPHHYGCPLEHVMHYTRERCRVYRAELQPCQLCYHAESRHSAVRRSRPRSRDGDLLRSAPTSDQAPSIERAA